MPHHHIFRRSRVRMDDRAIVFKTSCQNLFPTHWGMPEGGTVFADLLPILYDESWYREFLGRFKGFDPYT